MAFEKQAFNGDNILLAHVLSLKEKFGLTTFFETGTYLGETTMHMADHFPEVITCELLDKHQKVAKVNCKGKENVYFFLMDSVAAIEISKNTITEKTLFFLDAHWEEHCPLKDEIEMIASLGLKPVIVIHDFWVPGKSHIASQHGQFGWDRYKQQILNWPWIKDSVEKVYGKDYTIEYPTQVEGAARGYITIMPK